MKAPKLLSVLLAVKSLGIVIWGIRSVATACLILAIVAPLLHGEGSVKKIVKQDSTLNNLVDPPGYQTSMLGTLGGVVCAGTGTQAMILIPGLGFGGNVFSEFMQGLADQCRMYAVTIPGMGGTPAPPCPNEATSFSEQTWTNSALAGIEKLIVDESIKNPIIVGHWLNGTQLALRLALKHPDQVKAVILLTPSTRSFSADTMWAKYYGTLEKRIATVDKYFAPKWFKTVTRETWDDNNFLPGDYAVNPVRGLRLWREASAPKLHVWIRYLCEFHAQDITGELGRLTVPTLILRPGLEGLWFDGPNYMEEMFGYKGWMGFVEQNPKITVKVIPNSRACLWFDQPEEVKNAVLAFLGTIK
jgi:pimeloyl-ACP methyl ester carboxylesterase